MKLITQKEAIKRSLDRLEKNRKKDWGLTGHDTGHHYLNMMIGGWIPTKVTTIGARSGVGKTALTTQMFQAGARVLNKRRAEYLFFTWEMESSYLVDRHICNVVGLTNRELSQGAKLLDAGDMISVKDAYKNAEDLPVMYHQNSLDIGRLRTISESFVKICEKKSKDEGIDVQPVIVIDYIGLAMFESSGLRTYGIADFLNGCKQLANETGAAVCVFSQINRSSDEKKVPGRVDFSDSQSIEQASDNLILMHRPEYHGIPRLRDPRNNQDLDSVNRMLVRTLKSRDFGTSDAVVHCAIKYYRFWDEKMASWDEPYWEWYSQKDFWLEHFGLKNRTHQLKIA
jgi:replicative DNA helicase